MKLGGRPLRGAGVGQWAPLRCTASSSRHSFAPAGRERLLPGELIRELLSATKAGPVDGAAHSIGVAIATRGGVSRGADIDARVLVS